MAVKLNDRLLLYQFIQLNPALTQHNFTKFTITAKCAEHSTTEK